MKHMGKWIRWLCMTALSACLFSFVVQAGEGTRLYAGAGSGEIRWEEEVIRAGGENFSGEYFDVPHARVLLLEDEERAALVSLELVQAGDYVDDMIAQVSEALEVPEENVWIHCIHTTTTLHLRSEEAAAPVFAALEEACGQALEGFQPAVMGIGEADLDINVNRNIPLPEGLDPSDWTGKNAYGFTGEEYSPKDLTVLRFDGEETGEPLAFYLTYPMKPVGLDQSGSKTGERLISADIPGYACRMVEESLGAPCLFFMPAAGDQVSRESATVPGYLEDGTWGQTDLGVEKGKEIIQKYGTQMGEAAIAVAEGIKPELFDLPVRAAKEEFLATSVNSRTGEKSAASVPVSVLTLGEEAALVGVKPELDAVTGTQIKEASPYPVTLPVTFLNGDSKYMPHGEAWDFNDGLGTQEVIDGAAYTRGTAEKLAAESARLLSSLSEEASESIENLQAVGVIAPDGAKLQYIVLTYGEEVLASSVSLEDFEADTYGTIYQPSCDLGENPGVLTSVTVSAVPDTNPIQPAEQGRYVILEVSTDDQLSSMPGYRQAMLASVYQAGDLKAASGAVLAHGQRIGNVEFVTVSQPWGTSLSAQVDASTIYLPELDRFEIHDGREENLPPAHLEGLYSEQTGNEAEADLMYSVYIPEGYSEEGTYGLALVIPDATGMSDDDPFVALTATQHPVNLSGERGQALAREAGLDGLFVLVPQFTSSLDRENPDNTPLSKSSYDNMTTGSGVPAAYKLLDLITQSYPAIDPNRIYALGESGGGMMIFSMAGLRDNYFAGLWMQGTQWGNIYDREANAYFAQTYPYPVDGEVVTNADYQNWYYSVSDDNVLLTTCEGDGNATPHAREWVHLYEDIAGVTIPQGFTDPVGKDLKAQEEDLRELLSKESPTGLYWLLMKDGSHMQTFIYGPRLETGYAWLLSQTRASEEERGKLEELNRPWEPETEEEKLAAAKNSERIYFADENGEEVYVALPAEGAGTIGYTTAAANRGSLLPLVSVPVYDGLGQYADPEPQEGRK